MGIKDFLRKDLPIIGVRCLKRKDMNKLIIILMFILLIISAPACSWLINLHVSMVDFKPIKCENNEEPKYNWEIITNESESYKGFYIGDRGDSAPLKGNYPVIGVNDRIDPTIVWIKYEISCEQHGFKTITVKFTTKELVPKNAYNYYYFIKSPISIQDK